MKLFKIIALVVLAMVSNHAMAWGDREQGVLTGIGAVLLGQHIIGSQQHQRQHQPQYQYQEPQYIPQQRIYRQPAPVYSQPAYMDLCQYQDQAVRVYDRNGNVLGWRTCD